MTAREIVEVALDRGLLCSRGKTAERSMSAALYTASVEAPIRRTYRQGRLRAVRESVRWTYVRGGEES